MSYAVSDFKWGTPEFGEPSGVIPWSSDLDSGLAYNSASHDLSDFNDALVAALDAWEAVASVDFAPAGPGAAALTFGVAPIAGSAVGTAGITYNVLPGTDRITAATVTFDSTVNWAPYGGGGVDFFAVALHEIGHVLGLGHVSDPTEIMNPVISADTLGDGDIAGIQLIYGRDPGDAPASSASPGAGFAAADTAEESGDGGGAAIGLLGALMALLALIFGGAGAGAGAALAAGRVPDDDDSDAGGAEGHAHDHPHGVTVAGMDAEELMAALSLPVDWDDLDDHLAEIDGEDVELV